MSQVIRLQGHAAVCRLIRGLLDANFNPGWSEVVVACSANSGPIDPGDRQAEVFVDLAPGRDPDPDDPVERGLILDFSDDKAARLDGGLPPEVPGVREHLRFPDYLARLALRLDPHPRGTRSDLLIALYDVPREFLARCWQSLPKNPEQALTIVALAPVDGTTTDRPTYLILLPMASLAYDWKHWLRNANDYLAQSGTGANRRVELYARMPFGVHVDVYIQHEYSHPLPELLDWLPNEGRARCLLLGEPRGLGPRATRIIGVIDWPGNRSLEVRSHPRDDLEVRLEGQPEPRWVRQVPMEAPLRIPIEILPIPRDQRRDVGAIERRIREAKNALHELEQRRRLWHDRHREPCRFVLAFRQPATPEGQLDAPVPSFRRFLTLSASKLGQLRYTCVQDGRERVHLVLTKELAHADDCQIDLADHVFVQPLRWREWGLNAFVRSDCELRPAVEEKPIAEKFKASIDAALVAAGEPESGASDELLLQPTDADGPGLRITAVDFPPEWDYEFINREYPLAERQARAAANQTVRDQAEAARLAFDEQVQVLEKELWEHAEHRFGRVQEAWSGLAGDLDSFADQIRFADDERNGFRAVAQDLALSWRDFLSRAIRLNSDLVAVKLRWLGELVTAWKGHRDELRLIRRGNVEVSGKIEVVGKEIDQLRREAHDAYVLARLKLKLVRKKANEARTKLDELIPPTESSVEKAQTLIREVEGETRRLTRLVKELETANKRLEVASKQLDGCLDRFKKAVNGLEQGCDSSRTSLAAISQAGTEFDRLLKLWNQMASEQETALNQAKRLHSQAEEGRKTSAARIKEMTSRIEEMAAQIDRMEREIESGELLVQAKKQRLIARRAELDQKIGNLQKGAEEIETLRENVSKLEQDLLAEEGNLDGQARTLKGAAERLKEALAGVGREGQKAVAGLAEKLKSEADALDHYCKAREAVASGPIQDLLRRIRRRKPVIDAYHSLIQAGPDGPERRNGHPDPQRETQA